MNNLKMARDILLKLLEKESLKNKVKPFANKSLKNHKINKDFKTEDFMEMKNSVLDDYNNDYSYPRKYKDDQDNELLMLINDKLYEKYDQDWNKTNY